MEIFYQEKALHAGKKIRKNDFAPSENFPVTPLNIIQLGFHRTELNSTPVWKLQIQCKFCFTEMVYYNKWIW